MGIMSKSSRLSERPKPPTLNEIEDDLRDTKDTDIALSVGEKHLENINLASTCSQSQESDSPVSPTASLSSLTDNADVSQSQIKESYSKVLRLLDLYTNLKDAPADLQEKLSKLKVAGADMSDSISHLKSLSHGLGLRVGSDPDRGSDASGTRKQGKTSSSSLSKEKAKSKRKK